jgi:hypothetical protein
VVRSATNTVASAGRTDRIRAAASLTAAIFDARIVLSTTARRQYAPRADLLDWLEIEVLENRARAALCQRAGIAGDENLAVAKHTIRETGRRLVEEHEIDPRAGSRFELTGQRPKSELVESASCENADRNVDVTSRVRASRSRRAERHCVGDARIVVEDTAKALQRFDRDGHSVSVSQTPSVVTLLSAGSRA